MKRQIDAILMTALIALAVVAVSVVAALAAGPAFSPPELPTSTPPGVTAEPYPGPEPTAGPEGYPVHLAPVFGGGEEAYP